MNQVMATDYSGPSVGDGNFAIIDAELVFVQRFQSSIGCCLRRGFTLEECFGLIWEETLDEIKLPETEQRRVYDHLLTWAKSIRRR